MFNYSHYYLGIIEFARARSVEDVIIGFIAWG
jgi:hypothetical protein